MDKKISRDRTAVFIAAFHRLLAAARALDLDFVPLVRERYDIVIPADFLKKESVSVLLGLVRENLEFRDSVERLGGYDTSDMGKVMYES